MGVIATFDLPTWRAGYPQFSTVADATITGVCLSLATQYWRNDGGGPNCDPNLQLQCLNLAVAHICALFFGINGNAPTNLVGIIDSATEGSVSVGLNFPTTPNSAWFQQTPWGALFWQLTAPFRTMRYVPGGQFNQYGPLYGRGPGGFGSFVP